MGERLAAEPRVHAAFVRSCKAAGDDTFNTDEKEDTHDGV